MNEEKEKHLQQVALFRYGLIADLIHLPPGSKGIYERLRQKAEPQYDIPGTTRTRVAAETIRGWLKQELNGVQSQLGSASDHSDRTLLQQKSEFLQASIRRIDLE